MDIFLLRNGKKKERKDCQEKYLYIGSEPYLLQEFIQMFGWQGIEGQIVTSEEAGQALALAEEIHPKAVLISSNGHSNWALELVPRLKEILLGADILVLIPPLINHPSE